MIQGRKLRKWGNLNIIYKTAGTTTWYCIFERLKDLPKRGGNLSHNLDRITFRGGESDGCEKHYAVNCTCVYSLAWDVVLETDRLPRSPQQRARFETLNLSLCWPRKWWQSWVTTSPESGLLVTGKCPKTGVVGLYGHSDTHWSFTIYFVNPYSRALPARCECHSLTG